MKNLICINTYKSVQLIKIFVWDYILFVQSRYEYDIVVSLDGTDKDTIEYCNKYNIPLVYSDENEGVGISKNRIIKEFPEYDNYFFIEDDVDLLNSDVFDIHVNLSQALNIPHFSLHEENRIKEIKNVITHKNYHIIQAMYGSAQVNFFTKKGLDEVGGFHTEFAKYKRFGHTEHSYRFYHAKLMDTPFNIIQECIEGYFRWNNPKARTIVNVEASENNLFVGEEALIQEKPSHFPLETLSEYHCVNTKNMTDKEKIQIDLNYKIYKKLFYFKSNIVNFLKKIKHTLVSIIRS